MLTRTDYGEVTVITLKGELTVDTVGEFVEQRDQAVAESRRVLVVDCQAVTAFDSAGLEALEETRRTFEQMRGALKLCALDPIGRKILEITRLNRKFEIYDDLDSAVRSHV